MPLRGSPGLEGEGLVDKVVGGMHDAEVMKQPVSDVVWHGSHSGVPGAGVPGAVIWVGSNRMVLDQLTGSTLHPQ